MSGGNEEELFYNIALTRTAQVGDKMARHLLHHFENAREIFHVPFRRLASVAGLGPKKAASLRSAINEKQIREEIAFIRKHAIQPLFIDHPSYPALLRHCADAPVMLYYKGNADPAKNRMVAIIGTRKNTAYGTRLTEELVEGLQGQDVTIVSGLAFGVDVIAHQKALHCGIPTIGVLAHGMDTIYPAQHRHIARQMIQAGGLLTEYPCKTLPDKYNFPMRNRIVAGMCAVTVVVETELKGGAMITARLALDYNREVAVFPGRVTDKKSEGCNHLIRSNAAQMITGAADLLDMMNWGAPVARAPRQQQLFEQLTPEQAQVLTCIGQDDGMHIDIITQKTGIGATQLSAVLLALELNGSVKTLPGKRYRRS